MRRIFNFLCRCIGFLFRRLQYVGGKKVNTVYFLNRHELSLHERHLFDQLFAYYAKKKYCYIEIKKLGILRWFSTTSVLSYKRGISRKRLSVTRNFYYNVDPVVDIAVCDEWNRFHNDTFETGNDIDWEYYCSIFKEKIDSILNENLKCAYIFGTGPSLEKAIAKDFTDGYRIVCNTIVRDEKLFNHIDPHFIVAGDALYHFSPTEHAINFRNDLRKRLTESNSLFLYPSCFHWVVMKDFSSVIDKCIPVQLNPGYDITLPITDLIFPASNGNVLNILLLPLACTLSKSVKLWGFDGRDPDDKESFFWKNSLKHTYSEFIEEMVRDFPAFYEGHVPKNDKMKYIKTVHGSSLEDSLAYAEAKNWNFKMLHHSWTTPLHNRE